MNAETFLGVLRSAMPSAKVLKGYGLDKNEIGQIQSTFIALARDETSNAPAVMGEVGRLITGFDCTTLEIGLVRFDRAVSGEMGNLRFGRCEADPLVIAADGRVLMLDHALVGSSPVVCAAHPELFLDAMAAFCRMRAEKDKWKGRGILAAEECSKASGDALSMAFYRILCGFING